MSTYTAPMKDMQFVLHELAGLDAIARLPGYGDVSTELVDAVLEGAATFSSEVWGPLNKVGDQQGLKRHDDGRVTTPKGFVEAYAKFVESGWNGLRFDPAFGGQGLPKLVDTAVMEMWKSANMAFSLCPMLTNGAIESIKLRGTDEQKAAFRAEGREPAWRLRVPDHDLTYVDLIRGEVTFPAGSFPDFVVVRASDNRLIALDARDGSRRWVYQRSNPPLALRSFAGVVLEGPVVLAGFLTNCCVESTMRSAYENGYRVITLTDCTAATSTAEHENAIAFDYPMFSEPVASAEVAAAL